MNREINIRKNTIVYDVRILLPVMFIFLYTLLAVFYSNFLKYFFFILWLAFIINVLFLIVEYYKTKSGYGFHSASNKGKPLFLYTIFIAISLIITLNLFVQKNQYDLLFRALNNEKSEFGLFVDNNSEINNSNTIFNSLNNSIDSNKNKSMYYVAKIKQYLDRTSVGYKTVVTVTHIGSNKNSLREIDKFDAVLLISDSNFTKENNIGNSRYFENFSLKNQKILNVTKNQNALTEKMEKFYTPDSVIVFNAKAQLGEFYNTWVVLKLKGNIYECCLGNKNIKNQVIKLKDSSFLWGIGKRIRENILKKINLGREYDSLILGMSVGNTNYISDSIMSNLKNTGTVHLTSVSGTHLCMITIFLNSILFWCKPRKRMFIVTVIYIFFLFIIGPLIPILRSISMGILGFGAILSDNQRKTIPIFSIIFIVFIVYNPLIVTGFSFLLSSFSTLGIILFVKPMLNKIKIKFPLNESILNIFLVSLNAQFITIPITLFFTPDIPIFAVFTNTIISPIASLVTILGILIGVSAEILPDFMHEAIGDFLYKIVSILVFCIGEIITLVSNIPFNKIEWGSGIYQICVYVLIFILPFIFMSLYKQLKDKI